MAAAISCNQSLPINQDMVLIAENERYEAVTEADTVKLSRLLAEEFIYNQPTAQVATKAEYLKQTSDRNPAILSAEFTLIEVQLYDGFAVSKGVVQIEAVLGGQQIETDLMFLNLWVVRNGRLQLAARQSAFMQ